MPYIPQSERSEVDWSDPGHLTFLFYNLAMMALPQGARYVDYHRVIGAIEAAKLEFYRRHVAPYEDTKIEQNGDVL